MKTTLHFFLLFNLILISNLALSKEVVKTIPSLELISSNWTHEEDSSFAIVVGQVKNISMDSISQVQAVASFSDSKGNFISSQSTLIEFDPIVPDQISPFRVMVPWNPVMKQMKLDFKKLMGATIQFKSKDK